MNMIGNIVNMKSYLKTGAVAACIGATALFATSCNSNNKSQQIDKTPVTDVFQKHEIMETPRENIDTTYVEERDMHKYEVTKFKDGTMTKVFDDGCVYDFEEYYPNGQKKSNFFIEKFGSTTTGSTVEVLNEKGQQIYYVDFNPTCRDGADEYIKYDNQGRIIEDIDGTYKYNDDGSYTYSMPSGKCNIVVYYNATGDEVKTEMHGEDGTVTQMDENVYKTLNAPEKFIEMKNTVSEY